MPFTLTLHARQTMHSFKPLTARIHSSIHIINAFIHTINDAIHAGAYLAHILNSRIQVPGRVVCNAPGPIDLVAGDKWHKSPRFLTAQCIGSLCYCHNDLIPALQCAPATMVLVVRNDNPPPPSHCPSSAPCPPPSPPLPLTPLPQVPPVPNS